MKLSRDVRWLLAGLLFGLLVLPFLVYFTGTSVLGPYSAGGPGAFFADYVGDLARLRWFSWALALGPLAVVLVWRILSGSLLGSDE